MARTVTLEFDEEIILDYTPSAFGTRDLYVLTLGLWAIWRRRQRFIVTTERVIVTRGILFKSVRTVRLSRIRDTTLKSSRAPGNIYLAFSSTGGPLDIDRIGPLSASKARSFADAIRRGHAQSDGV